MKKLAFLIFAAAITIGIGISYATGNVGSYGSFFSFNFKGVAGSGNIKTETRDLAKFKSVDFGGAIAMEIVAQKAQNVEFEADDNILPLITAEVKNDTLYISNRQSFSSLNPIKVRISVEELNGLDISGAAKAVASNIKAESFDLDLSGAAKASVSGEVSNLEAEASGGSVIETDGLKAVRANVSTSGGARASVFASDSLDANASGGSRISFSGNPANVNKKVSGGASVRQN